MNTAREKALTRLSLTALAIDALVIFILFLLLLGLFSNDSSRTLFGVLDQSYGFISFLLAFIFSAVLHLFVVEIVLGGFSVGRFCTGLSIRNSLTGDSPSLVYRFKRFTQIVACLGLNSLRSKTLAGYNKEETGCLCSDWIEFNSNSAVFSEPIKGKVQFANSAKGPTLSVISGPEKGKVIAISEGREFKRKGTFIIGREPSKCDLALSEDKSVSRVHCRIVKKDKKFLIADGANSKSRSSAGTFLNGKVLATSNGYMLSNGDKLKLGATTVQIKLN